MDMFYNEVDRAEKAMKLFDSYFEVLGKRIEKAGRVKAKTIQKVTDQLIKTDDTISMIGLLDSFDKDEIISIAVILTNKMKEMKRDMERLEDDGK